MNNKPLITLFEENEMNIAALYSLYAQQLPEQTVFWNRMSNEEIGHAAQIGNEKDDSEEAIPENKFSRGIIKYLMDFVLDEINKAQHHPLSHRDALLTALRIEQSMLERKCFDLFLPTKKTLQEVFFKLNRETERHVEYLQKEMKKNKFSFKEPSK
ncbi:MAG: hypothetical protein ACD_9C00299G0002 [uncultured bacterium]|nr:MAG: hypothetical protein ACD_9C00299G0002 [uncultured bacterium]KKQ46454.1 MAG: hypothetical protein US63_C0001G0022 [Candidatus Moranbacteria bacterium GW2011_GWC2_37_8]KKQ63073.1 MAG: hypothetical protein US82_C0003G0022 [Parcubacteria group bacterium GW2011_GWC1_38_22]KKQ79726.1 MAG: hypothetical protein UT03_C0043G0006 [Candidatus Moranbacteria bacterium GW2011_GWD2_38_7]